MSQHENDIRKLKRQLDDMRHAHQEEILHLREQHRYELEYLNKELRQQHQRQLEEQKKREDEKLRRSEERYRMQIERYAAEVSELRRRLY